ncbi:hypothetical protein DH2020_043133 [Rehmannia glutinosa]|uniref:Tr-type G domain-containing protein n=1 Tax=Rehmannia glutinosa TaxID=99300 RepID=A0ABR0UKQ2_REHGL
MDIPVKSEVAAKGSESSSASVTRERHNGVNENDSASCSGKKPVSSSAKTESSSSKTGKAEILHNGKTATISQYNPETWMIPNKVDTGLSQLNLAIVGHVDSGKSTLSGRLLHLLGQISQKVMHKYEKEAKQQGKDLLLMHGHWMKVRRKGKGYNYECGSCFFHFKKISCCAARLPGHRDFVPNMISGATQADAAIIVIDASMGSFEAGIDAVGGQTREHAQLVRSFGVDQIIVVVNKMDVVEYSKERFDEVKQKLGTFLRSCGFKVSSILWIPASAMENQNLVANPSDARLSWFNGPSLLDAIDSLQLPDRDYTKPLLMPICDVIKSQSQGQVSACGKLESGAIRTGFKVLVMPSREIATARSLERDSQPCSMARAGDNVTVNLQGIEGNRVTAGGVICHPDYPVEVANHLELKILVLDVSTPIVMGSQLEFHIHHAKEAARVVKILSLLDPKTGKPSKKSPRCLLAKQNAMVEVVLQGPVCVEEYSKCKSLGRVFLRASGRTVALGILSSALVNARGPAHIKAFRKNMELSITRPDDWHLHIRDGELLESVHGEVTSPDVDVFDREKVFIDTVLSPLIQKFPQLKVVMEHITTMDAVNFVESCDEGRAIVSAVTSGSKRFFLGTDSAPHDRRKRECPCGCAGIYNSPVALSVYAKVFEEAGALEKLEAFTSFNGPDFYGLPRNTSKIKLIKTPWKVPKSFSFTWGNIVPMFAGETLEWLPSHA